ncbi:hypothetical protein CDL15_Pgr006367 [Punica granatum]|uniref:Uncharacterized protein n=1 Tax=Punica granatum TaxID=22663 RepID=A0A218VTV9_PUNGR|nr:hypothetical protein CDL15_Pgr006367 [Punica granatum]
MDIGSDASIVGSDGGGGTAAGSVTGGGGMLTGWTAGTCTAGDGAQGFGSTIVPYPGGGVEFEKARFGPLSKAMSSTMSAAIWLTVPLNVVMPPSSAAMHAASSAEEDGSWAIGEVPWCVSGTPARVSGGASVAGG